MADSLLIDSWLNKLVNFHNVYVGFSGGLDSTVLLHSLASQPALAGKLQAVHINHGLSKNAAVWQMHCQAFCKTLSIPLITRQVEFDRKANIEENARIARYQIFASLLAEHDCLLLAHHGDDQAETLLLQLLRGAGIDGMAAMAPVKQFAKGALVRPFLQHSRQLLEAYAHLHNLTWVEDESNQDSAFSRNYIRQHIMPLLQAKWPGAVGNLMRSAVLCQQAKTNLEALANIDYAGIFKPSDTLALSASLYTLDISRLANVLRVWIKSNQVRPPSVSIFNRLIHEVILASADAMPSVQWGDVVVRRYQDTLYLLKNEYVPPRTASIPWPHFPARLKLEDSQYVHASPAAKGLFVPPESEVQIRFRKGGELFHWHGQTKQLKKLLQQWKIPPWTRDVLPLLYIDGHLAAVVGFAISDHYYAVDEFNSYHLHLQN